MSKRDIYYIAIVPAGTDESAPLLTAPHNSGERMPSSDAACGGADTAAPDPVRTALADRISLARLFVKMSEPSRPSTEMTEAEKQMILAALRAPQSGGAPLEMSISDEMLDAHLKATGEWVEPHDAERECGVPIECDISQADADQINTDTRAALRKGYEAAFGLSLSPPAAVRNDDSPNDADVELAGKITRNVIEQCAQASDAVAKRFRFSYGASTTQSAAIDLATQAIRALSLPSTGGGER